MKNRPDTREGANELRMLMQGERIFWFRESPQLKREMTIYPPALTPEQLQRLNQIEQELLVPGLLLRQRADVAGSLMAEYPMQGPRNRCSCAQHPPCSLRCIAT